MIFFQDDRYSASFVCFSFVFQSKIYNKKNIYAFLRVCVCAFVVARRQHFEVEYDIIHKEYCYMMYCDLLPIVFLGRARFSKMNEMFDVCMSKTKTGEREREKTGNTALLLSNDVKHHYYFSRTCQM